jgi:hypothetical protein
VSWPSFDAPGVSEDNTRVVENRDHDTWVHELVQALKNGTPLDLARGEDLDLTQAADWPASRRMPGEALRAALLTPDVRPDPRSLKIRGGLHHRTRRPGRPQASQG